MKRLYALVVLAALGCQGTDGTIERHGSGGAGRTDGAAKGEYGDDPGEADARQDYVFTPPDDPDGGAASDEDASAEDAIPADTGGPVLRLEEAVARIAHATCQRRLDCCMPAERAGVADATCEPDLTEQLAPFFDAYAREVGAGRAGYDGAALATCLATLERAACPEARAWEPLLAATRCGFVVATLPAGEDCRASYECLGGFCQGVNATRDGRCVAPRLSDGQPCERGEDCASGACHPLLDVCAAPEPGNVCD
jgi:hypothetical protein